MVRIEALSKINALRFTWFIASSYICLVYGETFAPKLRTWMWRGGACDARPTGSCWSCGMYMYKAGTSGVWAVVREWRRLWRRREETIGIHDGVAAGCYSLVAVVMRLWLGQGLNEACLSSGEWLLCKRVKGCYACCLRRHKGLRSMYEDGKLWM